MQITELTLQATDITAQVTFYTQMLGLELIEQRERSFTARCGISRLQFVAADQGDPIYHLAWSVPSRMFASAKKWVADRVPLLTRDGHDEFPFKSWNAHSVYFRDPAGNILEFIARHDLPTPGLDGPFGPHALVSISEIGVPVPDVPGAVRALQEQFGVLPYGDMADDFAALGDIHGLLIVVKMGRVWMPTSADRATSSPLEVRITAPKSGAFEPPGAHVRIIATEETIK